MQMMTMEKAVGLPLAHEERAAGRVSGIRGLSLREMSVWEAKLEQSNPAMRKNLIGYQEAIQMTLENIEPVGREIVPLAESVDRVIAADLQAKVNSPSVSSSLKDGYAVRSGEIAHARLDNPVTLKVLGAVAAGVPCDIVVTGGGAVRIQTGAKIPRGC